MRPHPSWIFRHRRLSHFPGRSPRRDAALFPISLRVFAPSDGELKLRRFDDVSLLKEYVQSYRGILRSIDPITRKEVFHKKAHYSSLDPCRVYDIHSPFYQQDMDGLRHHQSADQAFEDKSRRAMQTYFKEHGMEVRELSRLWYNEYEKPNSKMAIEWEGVWDGEGAMYVLESKHVVSAVIFSCDCPLTNM